MYCLIYLSAATREFTATELANLLRGSRERNARREVTGILLYKAGKFLQVIEGEQATVEGLFAKVSKDPRHQSILVLIQGEQAEREFPDHSMAFQDLNGSDVHAMPGYSEFLNTPLTGAEFYDNPSRVKKLLLSFKKNAT